MTKVTSTSGTISGNLDNSGGDGIGAFRAAMTGGDMAPSLGDASMEQAGPTAKQDPAAGQQPSLLTVAPGASSGFVLDTLPDEQASFAAARAAGLALEIDTTNFNKLQMGLSNIFVEALSSVAGLSGDERHAGLLDFTSSNSMAKIHDGMVAIDVVANNGDGAALLAQLQALGMQDGAAYGAMAGGYIPIDSLDEMAALGTLAFARPVYETSNVGVVTGQPFQSMNVDTAVAAYAGAGVNGTLDGAGITIGVISDSFDTRSVATTHYSQDVTNGDLPAGIVVLTDSAGGTDEGRAMAQAAYDIAPGTHMAFSSANPSQAAFANSIVNLAKPVASGGAGADIVVDDVIYFAEPMFQDGIIAQAVGTATNTYGAMYFSSAGNQSTQSWDGINLALSGTDVNVTTLSAADNGLFHLLDFDPGAGVDFTQTIQKGAGSATFIFSWDQPSLSAGGVGSASDIAIFILNSSNVVTNIFTSNNIGGDPIEGFSFSSGSGAGIFRIAIGVRDGNALPGDVKWVGFGSGIQAQEYATFSATSYGHSNAATAISVGASDWVDSSRFGTFPIGQPFPYAETFTSKGGVPILFNGAGSRLATPIDRGAVDITASDGGNNSFFGSDVSYDADSFPNFYGTSQAAPNAAAVAALLMQKFPNASNSQIELALKQSALDIIVNYNNGSTNAGIGVGPDAATGTGLIQADVAVQKLALITNHAPTIGTADLVGAVTELTGPPVGNLTDSGTIGFNDVDGVWAHVVSPTGTPVGTVVGALTASVTHDTAADGSGGVVTWNYTVPDAAVEYLAAGQTLVDHFTITIDDQHGGTVSQQIAVTITGTGDAPNITVGVLDVSAVSGTESNSPLAGTFTLSVTDTDVSDTVTPSVLAVSASGDIAGLPSTNAALKAMLSVSPPSIPANPGDSNNLTWSFNSAPEAFNYLDEGESLILTYTIRATDSGGLTDDQNVTVTISGTNDAPTIGVVSPSDSDSVTLTDGNSQLLALGTLSVVDPDWTDSVSASLFSVLSTPAFPGAFGLLTLSPVNLPANLNSQRNLNWTFTADAHAFDFLAAGASEVLVYQVLVTDDSGATATKSITVTINGVNDAPVVTTVTGSPAAINELPDHAVGENSQVTATSGSIAFTDADSSSHTASFAPQSGSYLGTFSLGAVNNATHTVTWDFSVSDGALNWLAQGQVVKQFYDVTVDDGQGGTAVQTIEVDLVGSNDAAIVSSANVVVEQGATVVATGGDLYVSDEDGPNTFLPQTNLAGTYGHFSIDAAGHWTYTANSIYVLAPNEVRTDVFTALATDGTPTTVAVTIAGHDSPAMAQMDLFFTDETNPIGPGLNLFNDNHYGADSDPDGPLSIVAVNGYAGAVGHLIGLASGAVVQVNADGTFSYDPNHAFDWLTQASGAADTFAFDQFSYTLAGGSTAMAIVNISGINSPDDLLFGNAIDNAITGTSGSDSFIVQQGGHDSAYGLGGDDGFYFGNSFDHGDIVDGGHGNDTLAIQGDTDTDLGEITNVENLLLLSGSITTFGDTANNRYSYDLTTNDGNVAPGETLTVIGSSLLPGENIRFDGSAETDGGFAIFAGQGVDSLTGGAGSDGFFFGADGNLTGADHVDGGAGFDTLALRGNYVGAGAVTFANSSMANIEVVALLSGHTNEYSGQIVPGGYDYDVTMADGNVAAGQQLDVNAAGLAADESVRFDGRAESNGSFRILSGAGDDTLYGGAGNDTLYGGLGADRLEGGAGADTYWYRSAAESTSTHYDRIVGFDSQADHIDVPGATPRAFTQAGSGALSAASFDADLTAGLNGVLGANQAALFTANSGTLSGHVFAVIDVNGTAGYQAGEDLVIELVNPVNPIDTHAMVIA